MITNSNISPKSVSPPSTSKDDYQNKSGDVDTHSDSVKVEICELDNSLANATTVSLMQCKKQILHPFRKLLCLIGWRPFGVDSVKRSSLVMRILNIVYPILIFMLLLFNYIYEIAVCQGKLNVAKDTKTTSVPRTAATPKPNINVTNMSVLLPPLNDIANNNTGCGHTLTMYIVPDILHCTAFMIGFVYFRTTEGEPMYSLMEKVFIHADQNMRLFSPSRIIRRLKIFLLVGCIWVLATVIVHALSVIITDFQHHGILNDLTGSNQISMQYSLFIIDIICLLIKNCINLAVAINFVSHCEMVIFYCKAIRTRLEEKSIQLLEAMKQILDLRLSISQLNSAVSRMMSLLIVYFLDRTILGIILLVLNENKDPLTYVYRALYPIVWICILIFCLSQAARVTSKCDKFHRISHTMRVYGYPSATPTELDGFLLFISVAELRAKLLGLTIRPGKIIMMIITIMLVCITLIQTDYISNPHLPL